MPEHPKGAFCLNRETTWGTSFKGLHNWDIYAQLDIKLQQVSLPVGGGMPGGYPFFRFISQACQLFMLEKNADRGRSGLMDADALGWPCLIAGPALPVLPMFQIPGLIHWQVMVSGNLRGRFEGYMKTMSQENADPLIQQISYIGKNAEGYPIDFL